MVRLFIENNEVELDNTVQFAITKQFEDLSNPTDIINEWSKTISIPFTEKNNNLFGHIYCPDKVIVSGGTIGVSFNPLLKLDFRLEWNNAVIMSGYAKMNQVKQTNGKGTYEITLFGILGKVFQEMQKITFDSSNSDSEYYIDGGKYVSETINKELVKQSWQSSGQTTDVLKETTDSGYSITDILGFAPNNSFNEGFDYKSYQPDLYVSKQFTEVLDATTFETDTGVSPSTAIPNGLQPREIGEFRSYLQLPWIYWNKLFKIFKTKAESVTNYKFYLDSSWFNTSNPYWNDLVYMLKPFNVKNGSRMENSYIASYYNQTGSSSLHMWNFSNPSYTTTYNNNGFVYSTNYENISLYDSVNWHPHLSGAARRLSHFG